MDVSYAYIEAARFIAAAIACGALIGLVVTTIRTLRSSR